MGFESMPIIGKKEKTVEELTQEAYGVVREYRKAAEGRGARGSKEYRNFEYARLKLQKAIEELERRGVAGEDLQKLYGELEYPKEMG